jgi:hypothetical protein
MKGLFAIVVTAGCVVGGTAAFARPSGADAPRPALQLAQVAPQVPNLLSPIPAPLPPPAAAPTINGPTLNPPTVNAPTLSESMTQSPSPGLLAPAPLNTFSDRATKCLQAGSDEGLSGPSLDTFSGVCASEN